MVDVNCAAIPDSLIESELFGYEKGAFTGANSEGRKGYFDEAHEGTILLDEIGDASLQTQSKLLRVLESGIFKRVGGNRNIKVDVRIISSTNKDLPKLISENGFRNDLYYRLNAFTIHLPSLGERVGDIELLVRHFLSFNIEHEKRNFRFSPASLEILKSYHWPGNVRELKGVVNYALNMSGDSVIAPSSLPSFLFSRSGHEGVPDAAPSNKKTYRLSQAVQELEEQIIREVLEISENKTKAIERLGISRRAFYMKLKQYNIDF